MEKVTRLALVFCLLFLPDGFFLKAQTAPDGVPVRWQAETRIDHLMVDALPEETLPSETADRLQIRREPTYRSATPLYRRLAIGKPESSFAVVIDPGTPPVLWIDLNQNGDLADDYLPPVKEEAGVRYWDVAIPAKFDGALRVLPYRITLDEHAVVTAMAQYGQTGTITLDGHPYLCVMQPAEVNGQGLIWGLDLNRDGRVDGNPLSGERFDEAEPVNIDGHTYALDARGPDLRLRASDAEVDPKPHIAVGRPAPGFRYRTISGEEGRLASGSTWTLIAFWATWCRPCWDEFPVLQSISAHRSSPSIRVLSVDLDEMSREGKPERDLPAFLQQHQITWPVVYDHPRYSSSIARQYNVHALPVSLLVDPEGIVRWIGTRNLQAAVDRLLPVSAVSPTR